MLILTRRVGDSVVIGEDVIVTVIEVDGRQVRIGIKAPKTVPVHREEIFERIKRGRSAGNAAPETVVAAEATTGLSRAGASSTPAFGNREFDMEAPRISPFQLSMLDAIVDLSLNAWEPVFDSIANALEPDVFRARYPDWRVSQKDAVVAACLDVALKVWVASLGGEIAGFIALKFHSADRMGEIYMVAVEPKLQRRGVASALTDYALDACRKAGMTTVMAETGGDSGHTAARSTYESAGFRALPIVRYSRTI